MNPNEPNIDSHDDSDADAAVRRALAEQQTPPSAAHDRAILDAAKAMGDEPAIAEAVSIAPERTFRWPLALAATALLAIAVTITLLPESGTDPTVLRSGGEQILPGDGATLAQVPEQFSWAPGAAGSSYQLTLRNGEGERLWQSDWQAAAQITSSPTLQSLLEAGGVFFWSVEQRGAASKTLGPFQFTVDR